MLSRGTPASPRAFSLGHTRKSPGSSVSLGSQRSGQSRGPRSGRVGVLGGLGPACQGRGRSAAGLTARSQPRGTRRPPSPGGHSTAIRTSPDVPIPDSLGVALGPQTSLPGGAGRPGSEAGLPSAVQASTTTLAPTAASSLQPRGPPSPSTAPPAGGPASTHCPVLHPPGPLEACVGTLVPSPCVVAVCGQSPGPG